MEMNRKKIRILHLEDLKSDAELIERELKKGGLLFEKLVVSTRPAFIKALEEYAPDVILSDHALPAFDSVQALQLVKEKGLHVPFILITSSMTDEFAASVMREGTTDYIIKDRLQRLPSAILNSLEKFRLEQEKKEYREQIARNEKRFRTLIEKSKDMLTLTSAEGKITYASPSITDIFGYTPGEIPQALASDFIHPDETELYLENRRKALATPGQSISYQLRLKHKSGTWIWCDITLTNLLHEPEINSMVATFRDISEKKVLEHEKEFDRINLNALINNTNDLMWSLDRNFNLLTFNTPFRNGILRFTGDVPEKGINIFDLNLSKEDKELIKNYSERAFAGETFTETVYVGQPTEAFVEISYYPIRQGETVIGTACHSRNITERKKGESEREKMVLELIQRTKSLEQFAYIVSHNLRSPIANILGISSVLKSDISEDDREKSLGYLFEAVARLDDIIKDLNSILELRSELAGQKQVIFFSEMISSIETSIQHLLKENMVQLITDFTAIDKITTVKGYIYSVFLNLVSNSIKYKQRNLPVIIHMRTETIGKTLRIYYKDNGIGIDLEKYGDKLFGLYKRFHPQIEGKGLGLFMVKTQIETLGGSIHAKSEPYKGIEFIIELPLS